MARSRSFSPLFIGEVIVTRIVGLPNYPNVCFQSPIHRGSDCNYEGIFGRCYLLRIFPSPLNRGSDCNPPLLFGFNLDFVFYVLFSRHNKPGLFIF